MTQQVLLGSIFIKLHHIALKCLLGVEVALVVTQALELAAVVAQQPELWW